MATKKFVLDTNVILHDSRCIHNFDEHDIFIPMVVLEELDTFKKGNGSVNFHARTFIRDLSELSPDKMLNGGLKLGDGKGKLRIRADQGIADEIKKAFINTNIPDHHILNHCILLKKEFPKNKVILVSKDINLRMKAKTIGIDAEDYTTDAVDSLDTLYKGYRYCENVDNGIVDHLYTNTTPLPSIALGDDFSDNEYLIIRSDRGSVLGRYNELTHTVTKVDKYEAYGIIPRNVEQTLALHALMDNELPLVALSGKAGTGKTLLALAAAIENRKNYRQILLTRPIVALSNNDIGFLPGDVNDKIGPYMQPLFDNLGVIRNNFAQKSPMYDRIGKMQEDRKLAIEPLAFIRGRSLVKMFMIVDEAQNLTPHEVKTIITRAGEGTKIVFTGDIYQIDHPYLDSRTNGLSYLIHRMQSNSLFGHMDLRKGERSKLAEIASNLL